MLNAEWVVVNGARMHVNDLIGLTTQLYAEYKRTEAKKKSLVGRLIGFFNKQ